MSILRISNTIHHTQTTYQAIKTVSTSIHSELSTDQLPDTAENIDLLAEEVTDTARSVTKRTGDKAKDIYHTAALKADETLTTSKEYVRRNPVPVVLGAIAFGAAAGYLLVAARRKPSLRERYADEPLDAVRSAIISALSPVTHGIHKGVDSARDGAGKALDQVHRFGSRRKSDSFSDRLGRIGDNLKFW